jgi:gliding motility-associated-like protein
MEIKTIHARKSLLLLLGLVLCFCTKSYAQYEVYANQLISNTSDFNNPGRAVDANQANYARIATTLGVLTTSELRVRFPENGAAGDVVNVTVQGSGGLLSVDVLNNITIKLYDSAGSAPVATASGSTLVGLTLLTPGTYLYNLRFITNKSGSYKFREAKLELSNVLSVSLTEFRVYGFYFQRPCPPVYANTIAGSGFTPILSSVDNLSRIVDSNPDNFGTLTTSISLLGLLGNAYVDVSFPKYGRPGDYVGFTVAKTTGLLDLDVLGGLTVITYDESGTARETKTGSSLLDLKLLAGTTNRYSVGFVTAKGSYKISKIRLLKSAVVGLFSSINVYNAFFYAIERPPVTVSTSGPTSFCEGGSVTLTAYDSLGATSYLWNTGATTAAITVTTAGTYYVEVTDSVSCTRRSIPIGVEIGIRPRPVIRGDSVLCLGASGVLNLGSATYSSYLWNTGSTANNISSVLPGKYFVSVTDTNSCKGSDTIIVIQNKLNVNATITPSTCSNSSNGAISLVVSGGSGSYTYRWSDGSTAASITGKSQGIYACIIKDNVYGCSYNKSFSITSSNTLSAKISVVNTSGCAKTDGKINLSVIGGSGTYTYSWSEGSTSANLSNVGAGIYRVNITDATSGCSISDTVAVGDGGNTIGLSAAVTNSSSCSAPNGAATVTATGGGGSYTYLWSTGAITASVSGLKAGNYYVVVKDAANCSKALTVSVGNNGLLTANATVVKSGCKKQNGSVTISSVSGGSGSYTYAWSTGAATSSVTGLQAGTYIVNITDASSGCNKQEVYTVSDSSGPAATLSVTNPDCGSNSNGAISVTATGTNNVYSWSNGASSKELANLKPGTYTLTVTDTVTNCMAVYLAVLSAKSQMRITASPSNNTSCASAADGSIGVTVSGGTTPYTYSWSSGESTKDLSGKNAGTYTLTVSDANSCVATIAIQLATDSSKLLNLTSGTIVKATCNTAANGSIAVIVSGGKAPITYSWTPGGATSKDLVNVVAGTYTLTATDAVGCSKQLVATIAIDTAVAIRGTIDSTKASGCASSASGAVYVTISRGAAPYTYVWKKGTTTVATTEDLTAVTAGSYTLTATDNNGCSVVLNATVGVLPSGITVTLDSLIRPTCSVSADGKIYTTTSGGLAPYTYLWSTGATTDDITNANPGTLVLTATDFNGCPGQLTVNLTYDTAKTLVVKTDSTRGAGCSVGKSAALYITASGGTNPYAYMWSDGSVLPDLINVAPGTYTATVTDARGCKVNVAATLGVDTALSIKGIIDSVEDAGCIGSKSGKIYLTVTRGVAPYTYTWSNGATTEDILNAAPGAYSVIIGDAAGCSKTLNTSVGVDADKKIIITADSVRGATCSAGANGAIFVSIKGGQAPYTYSWSNGATTSNLMNVVPGFYTLTVLDANGCSAELSATISVDAAKSIKITAASVKDAGCSGNASGAINVTVSGGVAPYTYLWSTGATTRDISGLVPGSYTLTVKDLAGCSEEFSANIKVDTANLIKITATSVVAAKCAESSSGSVTVSITGGVPPYAYSWSNGATTKDLSFVKSGSYLLNVTDAIGCTGQLSVNVGINNTNPVVVKLDSVKTVGCKDTLSGAVYISVSGGTTPYTYQWSNSATTQDIIGVGKGAYMVKVTDDAGCFDNLSANVGVATPIVVSADVLPVNCNGAGDGSITVKVNGGSGNYAYKWTDGNLNANRSGLAAGSYSVNVTDVISGCTDTKTFTITQPDSLVVSGIVVKDSCLPGPDGTISLLVSGGVSPYSYSWSNGAVGDLIQGLAATSYSVTVTDSKGCSATGTYIVSEVQCDLSIRIHDVITPNGDGVNDLMVIQGSEFYTKNILQIVDKWGDLVYEKSPYDNTFNGTSSKNSNELPSGTYYYIFKLNEASKTGGDNVFKGAILIKR